MCVFYSQVILDAYYYFIILPESIGEFVEVDLHGTYRLTGVKTQGCASGSCCKDKWVTKYTIQYSDDGSNWSSVNDGTTSEKVDYANRYYKMLGSRFYFLKTLRPCSYYQPTLLR